MEAEKSTIDIRNYGKINLKLDKILKTYKITKNYLARTTNTRFEVIDKWYKNNVEKMDLDVLARICYVLDCCVADIIEFDKTK